MADAPNPSEPARPRPVVLPYQRVTIQAPVTVRKFYSALEAQLYANELADHDIEYSIVNQNAATTLGWYSGFAQVELQVHAEDAPEARQLLARLNVNSSDVEPADNADPQAPIPDPQGDGMLVTAAAYDDPGALYDAAATLGAAYIESFLPVLVPRGDRPRGSGNRFVIRVRQPDLERAREALRQEPRALDDEPRCPACGSWQTFELPAPWPGIWNFLLGRKLNNERRLECLRCHHRWIG